MTDLNCPCDSVQKIDGAYQCPKCGANYHMLPKKRGGCGPDLWVVIYHPTTLDGAIIAPHIGVYDSADLAAGVITGLQIGDPRGAVLLRAAELNNRHELINGSVGYAVSCLEAGTGAHYWREMHARLEDSIRRLHAGEVNVAVNGDGQILFTEQASE